MTPTLLLAGLLGSALHFDEPDAKPTPLDVGDPARPWSFSDWDGFEPRPLQDLEGQVVVVRFWTDSCPYCAKSLPALEQLSEEFSDDPVLIIGAYHSKPFGSERPWSDALERSRDDWGVSFPLAYDRRWRTLRHWWLEGGAPRATSSTFVIDAEGDVAFIHPGPLFFPSDDPAHQRYNRDFQRLREAIRDAVAQQAESSSPGDPQ